MADVNVTMICANEDLTAADAICETFYPDSNVFSVPLSTSPGVTDRAFATHWAGSGYVSEEMATALDVSLEPMFKVFPLEGTTFDAQLAACDPPLYRIIEEL